MQAAPLSNETLATPVLFLIFNRPEPTARVFEAIRAARPPRLYVAADGPRSTRAGEDALVADTRRIATQVDWPCKLITLFRDNNLGCKNAVSTAITWFFSLEEEGVVLEDDCVPSADFFIFCQILLSRYRSDQRIGWISGTSLCDMSAKGMLADDIDYVYARHPFVWGWASWRRVWVDYDVKLLAWKSNRTDVLRTLRNRAYRASAAKSLDRVARGEIDTWDYQVNYLLWSTGRLAIAPRFNLIENIGFTAEATHTKFAGTLAALAKQGTERLRSPLRGPKLLLPNLEYQSFQEALGSRTLLGKIFERIKSHFLSRRKFP